MDIEAKEDIIATALLLRAQYNTRDPFIIAARMGINVIESDVEDRGSSYYGKTIKEIRVSSKLDYDKQKVICAHELAHIIFKHTGKNYYKGKNEKREYCANLFAVALLFNWFDFNRNLTDLTNFDLLTTLGLNL